MGQMLCLAPASLCNPFQNKEEGRKEEREGRRERGREASRERGREKGKNITINSKKGLTTIRNKGYFCIK